MPFPSLSTSIKYISNTVITTASAGLINAAKAIAQNSYYGDFPCIYNDETNPTEGAYYETTDNKQFLLCLDPKTPQSTLGFDTVTTAFREGVCNLTLSNGNLTGAGCYAYLTQDSGILSWCYNLNIFNSSSYGCIYNTIDSAFTNISCPLNDTQLGTGIYPFYCNNSTNAGNPSNDGLSPEAIAGIVAAGTALLLGSYGLYRRHKNAQNNAQYQAEVAEATEATPFARQAV